jgi:hypothetical protein
MRVNLFTLRYSPTLGVVDPTPLSDFLQDKDVLRFREHFLVAQDSPHVLCVVEWQQPLIPPAAMEAALAAPKAANKTATNIPLSDDERVLFNSIREWRRDRSKKEGLAPYLILTDRQVVRLIRQRPQSRTALSQIEGIGAIKVERYGDALLRLLHGSGQAKARTSRPQRPATARAPAPTARAPPMRPPAPSPQPAMPRAATPPSPPARPKAPGRRAIRRPGS